MLLNVEVEGALVKLRLPEVRRLAEGSEVRLALRRRPTSSSSTPRPAAASTGAQKPRPSLMKAVFLLFDSLNRLMLEPYGGTLLPTPNFDRLAERTRHLRHATTSARCPACPRGATCMTGRLSFLHRSWGPLEPFDNAFPELLQDAGAHSHLITDHYHYWEDGGATYHTRYNSFDFVRGQEADPWKALVDAPMETTPARSTTPSRTTRARGRTPYART